MVFLSGLGWEDLQVPEGSKSDMDFRDRGIYAQLLELMLNLQQTIGDHFVKLTTRQWQAQSPGEANRIQVVREQEDVINHTVCQVISLLWTEAAADQRLHESLHSLNSREVWKKSPSPRQPDQPVRHVLSNRGVDISDFYQSHFQDYDAYQQDKYHEEKNPLGERGKTVLGLLRGRLRNQSQAVPNAGG
uniref:Uncharacterized protein n=1 Tax=Spermophilus dauricus TaxID=99837 RepID=A0A8C9UWK4_SPEDA